MNFFMHGPGGLRANHHMGEPAPSLLAVGLEHGMAHAKGVRCGLSTAPVRVQRQRHSGVQVADGSRERFRLTLTSGGTSTTPESPRVRS